MYCQGKGGGSFAAKPSFTLGIFMTGILLTDCGTVANVDVAHMSLSFIHS